MKSLFVVFVCCFSLYNSIEGYSFDEGETILQYYYEEQNSLIRDMILKGLEEYNTTFFEKKYQKVHFPSFVVYVKNDHNALIGGVCGLLFQTDNSRWAYVDYAWVDKAYRKQGVGRNLFLKLEEYVRNQGCTYIQLFTWEYQAVGFYEKLGYSQVGLVPDWIEGYDALFFRKLLKD